MNRRQERAIAVAAAVSLTLAIFVLPSKAGRHDGIFEAAPARHAALQTVITIDGKWR